ncbi:MAG: endonuclease III [Spirochaetes bacterium]|nr:endonuclease III [Spirochaetota bacterium]
MIDRATSKKIINILKKHYQIVPPLRYNNLYQLCVAVVLSAQTTDNQVNMVTPSLFTIYPDFASLAQADIHDVEKIIKPTGFYHNKARHIITLARTIIDTFNGVVPGTREDLMKLPGVGRKSANVILAFGFGIPAIPVDTHVARVASRMGYAETRKPVEIEKKLMESIPRSNWIEVHLLFIYHGRTVCSARNPKCSSCPVILYCRYENKNL